MANVAALKAHALANHCKSKMFSFKTTAELVDNVEFIGQQRAFDAIQFGIRIKHDGYNLYALGLDVIGKRRVVESILKQEAQLKSVPPDWCYVYNFKNPRCPKALKLPPGKGKKLQAKMEKLIENLKNILPSLLESEEHHLRIKKINEEVTFKQKHYFEALQEEAERHDMTILSTSKGFVVVPVKGGNLLTEKELQALSQKEKSETEEIREELSEQLAAVITKIQKLHNTRRKKEKAFETEITLNALMPLIDKIKKKFKTFPHVLSYLDAVMEDIAANLKTFTKTPEEPTSLMWGESHPSEFAFSRYLVNVIIDNSKTEGVPVIYEDNPRYYKLVGRIEHVSQLGALVTDFTLIRQGALHRANGGYLILDVDRILEDSLSWEALKGILFEKNIKIDLPPTMISVTSTSTLEPEGIPLDIKIILLGTREEYYLLRDTDEQFNQLFKVAVDFEEMIDRSVSSLEHYANMIATLARNLNLKPLDRSAVARVVDQSSRLMEDSQKLCLNRGVLINLLQEADHWAEEAGHIHILKNDIQEAINRQIYRLDHYQQLVYEEIKRETLFITTQGVALSQINALTTYRLGEFTFGVPSRITATATVGREGVIDIEREVELSGPIHSKGVLILTGFLRGCYAHKFPLTLSASIVFEQSYGPVEGDSASVAELCVLLSALSHLPIKQTLAVTGSINQHGLVQPIGSVNEKIEGFFDICKSQGLTGHQGVLIPKSNVKNLMLRDEVIRATRAKQFFIYPIESIDQAISLLMGVAAGQRDGSGQYPEGTLNYLVEQQLKEFARINRKWIFPPSND